MIKNNLFYYYLSYKCSRFLRFPMKSGIVLKLLEKKSLFKLYITKKTRVEKK